MNIELISVGDDPPNSRRAGEVDPLHGRMIDESANHVCGIFGRIGHDIDNPFRESCFREGFND